jgi:hypothetical protein
LAGIYRSTAYHDDARLVVADRKRNICKFELDLLARLEGETEDDDMPSLYESEVG